MESLTELTESRFCPDCEQELDHCNCKSPPTVAPPLTRSGNDADDELAPATRLGSSGVAPETRVPIQVKQAASELEGYGRYQLLERIGKGGMGVVHKARDTDIDREVAVKIILAEHLHEPETIQRFQEEARIGGQLQHPGIVPVYEVGASANRQPYFAMKLIKGQTVADLLKIRKSPQEDLPRFLGIFEQVCQAMAYAHDNGVIHRDLKPANIMVGKFGEVQVMDWGLAKWLHAEESPTSSPKRSDLAGSRSSGDSGLTRHGDVIGTWAYMPPEQALGQIELLSEQADVFSLGAILCEILTGRPPYEGKTWSEVERQAVSGDLTNAYSRLETCQADPELLSLTRRCLSPKVEDRPRNASEIAIALGQYLEGVRERLRLAELERVEAQAAASEARAQAAEAQSQTIRAEAAANLAQTKAFEERRRRKLQVGIVAATLALVILGGSALILLIQQRAARSGRVERFLASAKISLNRADSSDSPSAAEFEQAQIALKQAEEAAIGGVGADQLRELATVKQSYQRINELRELISKLDFIRISYSDNFDFKQEDRDYESAFKTFGLDFNQASPEEAKQKLGSGSASVEIAAAIDNWIWLRYDINNNAWTQLSEAVQVVDPDPWRNRLRRSLSQSTQESAATIRSLAVNPAELENQPAVSLLLLANRLAAIGERQKSHEILALARARYPGDFWVNFELGKASWSHRDGRYGNPEEAIRYLTAAVTARPKSSGVRIMLGVALKNQGKLDEAIGAYREAIQVKPDNAGAYYNIGNILHNQGKLAEAVNTYRKAVAFKPDYAEAHYNLARSLYDLNQVKDAIAAYQAAIQSNPDYLSARNNLGNIYSDIDRFEEALVEYRQIIDRRPNYAPAHVGVGMVLMAQKKFPEAIKKLQEAAKLVPPNSSTADFIKDKIEETKNQQLLMDQLPAILNNQRQPTKDEFLTFTNSCHDRRLYITNVVLWTKAFKAYPDLTSNPKDFHLYNAACSAALGGYAATSENPPPNDIQRAQSRAQAREWLNAQLALINKPQALTQSEIRENLESWKKDRDLVGVRDPSLLAKLPPAEQKEWQTFWAEVDRLLNKN